MDDGNDRRKHIDERVLYMIPAVIAISMALACMLFIFGNRIIDMNNTCYYIYMDAQVTPEHKDTDEFVLENIRYVMKEKSVSGYTVLKSLEGAFMGSDGEYIISQSYQIILMDISKKKVLDICSLLMEHLDCGEGGLLLEEVVMISNYIDGKAKEHRLLDFYHNKKK